MFRKMLSVCGWQLHNWRGNPRVAISLILCVIFSLLNTVKITGFARQMGEPLNVLEPFIFNASDAATATLLFLGLLLLLADAPFTEQSAAYSITRTGRLPWVMGKILYIISACVCYYLVSVFSSGLYTVSSAFLSSLWSYPFYAIVMNGAAVSVYHISYPNPSVMQQYSAWEAFLHSFLLTVLYAVLVGLILFAVNLSGKRAAGFAAATALHCFAYLGFHVGSLFLPFSHSLLAGHSFGPIWGDGRLPGIASSYLSFASIMLLLVCTILLEMRYVDLKISVGTKE